MQVTALQLIVYGNIEFPSAFYNLTGPIASSYFVTITNSIGCWDSDSSIIKKQQEMTLGATVFHITTLCNSDDSITVSPFGGTPGYVFNWSSGQTTSGLSNLSDRGHRCNRGQSPQMKRKI